MPTGIEVKNTQDHIVLDENWRNWVLKSKATYSVSGSVSFSFVGTAPIVAFRCSNYAYIAQHTRSGSTWNYVLAAPGAATTVDVYFFDVPTVSAGGRSLQIFNAAGELVLGDSDKPIRMVAKSPRLSALTATVTPVTGVSTKSYAAIQMNMGRYIVQNAGGMVSIRTLGARFKSDGIEIRNNTQSAMASFPFPAYDVYGQFMMVNVTNY